MTTPAAGASGGFRDAMSCDVCAELYDQPIKTPLVLPCGHTFCRPCLTDIKKSGRFHCPTCRAGHNNLQVEALTVNYSLLNILPLCNQFECATCTTHGDDLRYWCANCDLALCSICLYSGHPQGHTVKLAQTFVSEQKQKLEERINVIFKNIEQHKKELKKVFNDVDAQVVQLFRKNAHLHNTEVVVRDLLDNIRKANDIASVVSYETVVKELQFKKDLADPDDEKAREKAHPSGDALVKENLPAGDKDALLVMTEDPKEAGSEAIKAAKAAGTIVFGQPAIHRNTLVCGRRGLRDPRVSHFIAREIASSNQPQQDPAEAPRAVMDYSDGRLLLHTLAAPAIKRLSLQVPHEVFLELGVGDRRLGRVYIRLWCHLRRAQQFLALCMGTMGPSLLRAKASEKVRNIIVFRSAVDRNNQAVSHALLTGLEWGGQHSKADAEGLVTGMTSNNDMAFGICTQGHTGTAMHAVFGEVVAGLEVTKEAFHYNPVNEVTITSCGLVLPGLSQEG
ncbi:uncharacterized protein LOC135109276 [Scylla paramamosain]|uniref:uncharacterized protein LOC135109276 n=1 Tax=Scylla paramamosain TaxID=85552 RepID=UPI003083A355